PAAAPTVEKPAEKKDEPLKKMTWAEAQPKFDVLKSDTAFETALLGFGIKLGGEMAANQKVLLDRRSKALADLQKTMPGKTPEEIFKAWSDAEQPNTAVPVAAVRAVSKAYGGL